MKNIAIFASGTGSNARKIIEYFEDNLDIQVSLIISNKQNAGVLDIAKEFSIASIVISRDVFYDSQDICSVLEKYQINLLVLAGFLWLIPAYLIESYPKAIVNIHPALLPKYGGKGMYGSHVHRAVKAAGETQTGMTIHFANEHYDEGDIIFQAKTAIDPNDSPIDIAKKVLILEHMHYARTIEGLLRD